MVKIDDKYQVTIDKQDHFGSGIVKLDNFLVFVDGGLKGDEVFIKIAEVKKKYAKAKIEKIRNFKNFNIEISCKGG